MKADTKAFVKDIALTTLILVLICVIAGGILGGVNALTAMTAEEEAAQKLSMIYPKAKEFVKYEVGESITTDKGAINSVYLPKNDSGDILVVASGNGAYKSVISIMIVINNDKVKSILKYEASETPGLGENAFKDKFKEQFYEKNLLESTFELEKNGGSIKPVTAATKTSTAFVNAMNTAASFYKANADKIKAELGKIGGSVA